MNKIRRVSADDLPVLFNDFRIRYRFNPRIVERDYFDWQFFDQNTGRYNALAAWEGDRPVGFIGFRPFVFRICGQELPAAFPMQWFSDRRDGTGMHLFSAVMAESSAQIMLLNTHESQRIYQLMGMTIISQCPNWIGFLAADKVCSRFNIIDQRIRNLVMSSHERLTSLTADSSVARVASFTPEREYLSADGDVEAFARRRGSDLNWRYVAIPRHNYRLLEGKNGIAVWRVEKIMDTDESVIRILEWTFPSECIEAESAMAAIVADGLAENVILMDFHCTAIGVGNRLQSLGFYSADSLAPAFIPWLYRPLCLDPSVLVVNAAIKLPQGMNLDVTKLYLTRGDADVDRIKL